MMDRSFVVLLVEDSRFQANLIKEFLGDMAGFEVDFNWADSLSKGLERIAKGGVDCVLLDLSLPDSSGMETLLKVLAVDPSLPVIVLTGDVSLCESGELLKRGAAACLAKGDVSGATLEQCLEKAREQKG